MNSETWAIVAATFLGPLAAVGVSMWREWSREKRDRRLHVYRTLMATRVDWLSRDHVIALNFVELEFHNFSKIKDAFYQYMDIFDGKKHSQNPNWESERVTRLTNLLSEIGTVLNYKLSKKDIEHGGYSPSIWGERDRQIGNGLSFLSELKEGKAELRVRHVHDPEVPR